MGKGYIVKRVCKRCMVKAGIVRAGIAREGIIVKGSIDKECAAKLWSA